MANLRRLAIEIAGFTLWRPAVHQTLTVEAVVVAFKGLAVRTISRRPLSKSLLSEGLLDTATTALLLSAVVFSQLITHF